MFLECEFKKATLRKQTWREEEHSLALSRVLMPIIHPSSLVLSDRFQTIIYNQNLFEIMANYLEVVLFKLLCLGKERTREVWNVIILIIIWGGHNIIDHFWDLNLQQILLLTLLSKYYGDASVLSSFLIKTELRSSRIASVHSSQTSVNFSVIGFSPELGHHSRHTFE